MSQFTDRDFQETEHFEHYGVLVLFSFTTHKICWFKIIIFIGLFNLTFAVSPKEQLCCLNRSKQQRRQQQQQQSHQQRRLVEFPSVRCSREAERPLQLADHCRPRDLQACGGQQRSEGFGPVVRGPSQGCWHLRGPSQGCWQLRGPSEGCWQLRGPSQGCWHLRDRVKTIDS